MKKMHQIVLENPKDFNLDFLDIDGLDAHSFISPAWENHPLVRKGNRGFHIFQAHALHMFLFQFRIVLRHEPFLYRNVVRSPRTECAAKMQNVPTGFETIVNIRLHRDEFLSHFALYGSGEFDGDPKRAPGLLGIDSDQFEDFSGLQSGRPDEIFPQSFVAVQAGQSGRYAQGRFLLLFLFEEWFAENVDCFPGFLGFNGTGDRTSHSF